jgi:hypothetical protein
MVKRSRRSTATRPGEAETRPREPGAASTRLAPREVRRLAVFLGAGASVPHGYPTIPGVLPRILSSLRDRSWRRWGGLVGQGDEAEQRVGELGEILTILLPGLGRGVEFSGGASITDLMSLIDQLIGEARSPLPRFSEEQLRRARSTLQLALNGGLDGDEKRNFRGDFAAWILHRAASAAGTRVTVVSTNYDTVVEKRVYERLDRLGVPLGTCVDLGIPWRDARRDELHMRPRGASLAFLKLHGSLNWARCEVCGHIMMHPTKRIAPMEFWTRATPHCECWCNGRLRSVIVTPSYIRDVRDANLLSIWNAALEDLRRADEWILIGYSLPSEDVAIRSILLRAFHTRTQDLRIRVVQKCDKPPREEQIETRRRYEAFFPAAELCKEDYLTCGIEDFIRVQALPAADELDARLRNAFITAV